jgi:lipopolysaccharide biosynthesis protein
LRGWASGIDRRKPFPGFHPGIYQEQVLASDNSIDPLAHYIRAGSPEGPWKYPVIDLSHARPSRSVRSARVALHVHAYYIDLLPSIVERLNHNNTRPDIYLSVSKPSDVNLAKDVFSTYAGILCAVSVVPNKGRDIGPFLTEFGPALIQKYDVVGHLHTKKSADVRDAAMGETWYRFLLDHLLGRKDCAAMDEILKAFEEQPTLGMVFPDDPHALALDTNRAELAKFSSRIGVHSIPEYFNFPVGTMFWARSPALAPIVNLGLDWGDYPEEPLPYDGSTLHALERLLPIALPLGNLTYSTSNIPGQTR